MCWKNNLIEKRCSTPDFTSGLAAVLNTKIYIKNKFITHMNTVSWFILRYSLSLQPCTTPFIQTILMFEHIDCLAKVCNQHKAVHNCNIFVIKNVTNVNQ